MAFGTLGSKEDVELSWHDWNVAKDISHDGQFVLFEDSSEAAGPSYAVALRRVDGSLPVRLGEGSAGGLSPDGKWAISVSTGNHRAHDPAADRRRPASYREPAADWNIFKTAGLTFLQMGSGSPSTATNRAMRPAAISWTWPVQNPEPSRRKASCADRRRPIADSLSASDRVPLWQFIPPEGGPARPLGLPTGFHPVQWSQDGSALYGYRSGELPSKIYKVEIATGKETVVQELTSRSSGWRGHGSSGRGQPRWKALRCTATTRPYRFCM